VTRGVLLHHFARVREVAQLEAVSALVQVKRAQVVDGAPVVVARGEKGREDALVPGVVFRY
jgi:hypothetical protein